MPNYNKHGDRWAQLALLLLNRSHCVLVSTTVGLSVRVLFPASRLLAWRENRKGWQLTPHRPKLRKGEQHKLQILTPVDCIMVCSSERIIVLGKPKLILLYKVVSSSTIHTYKDTKPDLFLMWYLPGLCVSGRSLFLTWTGEREPDRLSFLAPLWELHCFFIRKIEPTAQRGGLNCHCPHSPSTLSRWPLSVSIPQRA